jgi:hypothetical protein
MTPRPIIAASARKHDVADADMIHAYRNPIRAFELDEGLMMLIGPDHAGNMLEIGVVAGNPAPVIVHAMRARPKFLERKRQSDC